LLADRKDNAKAGGDHDQVKVIIQSDDDESETLTIEAFDCFPEEVFESCRNEDLRVSEPRLSGV